MVFAAIHSRYASSGSALICDYTIWKPAEDEEGDDGTKGYAHCFKRPSDMMRKSLARRNFSKDVEAGLDLDAVIFSAYRERAGGHGNKALFTNTQLSYVYDHAIGDLRQYLTLINLP